MELLQRALAHWPNPESTWEGGPPTNIDFKFYKVPGCPPRMTPSTFDNNAKTFGSLMLNRISWGNGLIHARSVLIRRKTRISLPIRDTTDPLCSVQGPD